MPRVMLDKTKSQYVVNELRSDGYKDGGYAEGCARPKKILSVQRTAMPRVATKQKS